MRLLLLASLIGSFYLHPICLAQKTCPYINTATTSGALGEMAVLAVRQETGAGDICEYVAGKGKEKRSLYVSVRPANDAKRDFSQSAEGCGGKPDVVHALGNEAWSCRLHGRAKGMAIFGRVRDTLFVVRMTGIPDHAVLEDKTALAAEQVANNLY